MGRRAEQGTYEPRHRCSPPGAPAVIRGSSALPLSGSAGGALRSGTFLGSAAAQRARGARLKSQIRAPIAHRQERSHRRERAGQSFGLFGALWERAGTLRGRVATQRAARRRTNAGRSGPPSRAH